MNIKLIILSFFIGVMPLSAFAQSFNDFEELWSIDTIYERENQNITNIDLIKILLEKDGFTERIPVSNEYLFEDVDIDDAHYVEKMRQMGLVYRNPNDPNFKPDLELSIWKVLSILFKYEGVPVKRFLIDTEYFESKIDNIGGDSYLAPVFEKALEMDLIEPRDKKVFFLSKVPVWQMVSILEKFEEFNNRTNKTVINLTQKKSAFESEDKYAILEDVYNRIKTEYVDLDGLDETKLFYGAIEGMVEAIGDPFSSFQAPEEFSTFQKNLSNEFEGIGASLYINESGDLEVISPIANSPAESAGMLPGDVITKANGIKLRGLTIEESIDIIKGPKGTTVRLEIERGNSILNLSIVRDTIDIPLVLAEIHDGNTAYLKIRSFGAGTSSIFETLYENIKDETSNLIIDLRSNPGGYLNEAINIAELFLEPNKAIVNVKYNNITELKSSKSKAVITAPKIAILINKGSASASEILAAAIKENLKNSIIIGEKSFGKGTVQELINYRDNSALKLTIAEWLTPTLKKINKLGITPDIIVTSNPSDIALKNDPVLNRALIELR